MRDALGSTRPGKKCITHVKEINKILNKYLDAKLVQTSEDGLSDLWPMQSPEVFRLVAIYWTGRRLKIPERILSSVFSLNKIRFKIIQHFVFLFLKFSFFFLSLCLFCAEWLKKVWRCESGTHQFLGFSHLHVWQETGKSTIQTKKIKNKAII